MRNNDGAFWSWVTVRPDQVLDLLDKRLGDAASGALAAVLFAAKSRSSSFPGRVDRAIAHSSLAVSRFLPRVAQILLARTDT
jgi:hypothetical protein